MSNWHIWYLEPSSKISISNVSPGDRIAFINKYGSLQKVQKVQIARVLKSETDVQIKAGESQYHYWICTWYSFQPNNEVWLLTKNPNLK